MWEERWKGGGRERRKEEGSEEGLEWPISGHLTFNSTYLIRQAEWPCPRAGPRDKGFLVPLLFLTERQQPEHSALPWAAHNDKLFFKTSSVNTKPRKALSSLTEVAFCRMTGGNTIYTRWSWDQQHLNSRFLSARVPLGWSCLGTCPLFFEHLCGPGPLGVGCRRRPDFSHSGALWTHSLLIWPCLTCCWLPISIKTPPSKIIQSKVLSMFDFMQCKCLMRIAK